MSVIDKLAERHINEAMSRGEFDDLPGQGKPLKLDDDSLVPEELRAGYRLLKNSGFLPPELKLRKEINEVHTLLAQALAPAERAAAGRRLQFLLRELSLTSGTGLVTEQEYYNKIVDRLAQHDTK